MPVIPGYNYFILNLTRKQVTWSPGFEFEDIWNGSGKTNSLTLEPDASTILKVQA